MLAERGGRDCAQCVSEAESRRVACTVGCWEFVHVLARRRKEYQVDSGTTVTLLLATALSLCYRAAVQTSHRLTHSRQ